MLTYRQDTKWAQLADGIGQHNGLPAVQDPINQRSHPQGDHRSCCDILDQVAHCTPTSQQLMYGCRHSRHRSSLGCN